MLFLFIIQKNQFFGHLHNDATVFLLLFTSIFINNEAFSKRISPQSGFLRKNVTSYGSCAYISPKFRRKYDA